MTKYNYYLEDIERRLIFIKQLFRVVNTVTVKSI
jgi:hypothetical protein